MSPGVLTASCEIYDPDTGIWTPTGSLNTPRQFQQGVVLANGNVLVVGGLGMDGKGSFLTLGWPNCMNPERDNGLRRGSGDGPV